jgi:hypothetical protein
MASPGGTVDFTASLGSKDIRFIRQNEATPNGSEVARATSKTSVWYMSVPNGSEEAQAISKTSISFGHHTVT